MFVYPQTLNTTLVWIEDGAFRDTFCLTTLMDLVADIACPAPVVRAATARHDILIPAAPARTEREKWPLEPVTAEATVDHDLPYRCRYTLRPAANGETAPDRTTSSAGAATVGLTVSATVEGAACAGETAANGDTIATIAPRTTINRPFTMTSRSQREPKPVPGLAESRRAAI
jgi:hypothetical protein